MYRTQKPIEGLWDPLHAPMTGFTLPPESASDACPVFDFRSLRFQDDACALARATGCDMELCRQELFIAQGDARLALDALLAGVDHLARRQIMH